MSKVGTDIVEIARIEKAVKKRSERFINSIFTEREIEYLNKKKMKAESIAGGFAAKEAFSKYLGTGISGFSFKDIEVLHKENGKPYIVFKGTESRADLSISHTDALAIAVVVGDNRDAEEVRQVFDNKNGYSMSGKEIGLDMSVNLPMQRFVSIKKTEDELEKLRGYLEEMRSLIPSRSDKAHKGDCGKVFIVAGSKGMTGAAALSASAALRTGSGLVTVGVPRSEQPVLACKLTEAMTYPLACDDYSGTLTSESIEDILRFANECDIIVMGMGLRRNDNIRKIVESVIYNSPVPIVLDADGLNVIEGNTDILLEAKSDIIITPHTFEMSRLTGLECEYINRNRESTASEFAKKYKVTVVLKGSGTVIASKNGEVFVNITGNAGMASGGTGDVLSGIIGSLVGQGLPPFNAARLGVFIHGFAGDFAAGDKGILGMIASDVVDNIPYAIKYISE